jgi:hypothetical protein
MERKILVYGHGDKSDKGFENEEALKRYLKAGLYDDEHGRYHYTQQKKADTIIVAREGLAYGHLEVESMEPPNDWDRRRYPPVKRVYVISKSVLYKHPVRLADVGISKYQFGKYITEDEFKEIRRLSAGCEEFQRPVSLPPYR